MKPQTLCPILLGLPGVAQADHRGPQETGITQQATSTSYPTTLTSISSSSTKASFPGPLGGAVFYSTRITTSIVTFLDVYETAIVSYPATIPETAISHVTYTHIATMMGPTGPSNTQIFTETYARETSRVLDGPAPTDLAAGATVVRVGSMRDEGLAIQ